jgi:ABC-type uncharacterized transport system fused permease/ATPase subunit
MPPTKSKATDQKEKNLSFLDTMRSIRTLYGPYIGFSKGKRKLTTMLILLIVCNLLFIACLAAIEVTFSSLLRILELPHVTYTLFFTGVLKFSGSVTLYSVNRMISSKIARWIADTLCEKKNEELQENFKEALPYYAYTEKKLNVSHVFFPGQRRTLYNIFETVNSCLITHIEGSLSLYQLWLLSTTTVFVIASMSITIPAYILLAVLIYALGYNLLFSYMGRGYTAALGKKTEASNKIELHVHHMLGSSLEIGLTKMADQEKKNIAALEKAEKKHASKSYYLEEILSFMKDVYSELSMAMGIILSAPMIIAKQISTLKLLVIGTYFVKVTQMFSWTRDKFKSLAGIEDGIKSLSNFEKQLKKLKALKDAPKANISYSPTKTHKIAGQELLIVENLEWYAFSRVTEKDRFRSPNENPDLHNCIRKMTVMAGEVVNIQGKNGCGKSVLLKVLAGLWPQGSQGNIHFHCHANQVVFIPQKPYDPYDSTVNDILIAAGLSLKKNKETIAEILMNVALPAYSDIAEKKVSQLSGGEQQRLKIAVLLLKNPKTEETKHPSIIFLDEAFSAVDASGRPKLLALLRDTYPKAAFFCIHHESKPEDKPVEESTYTHCLRFSEDIMPVANNSSILQREVNYGRICS